MIRQHWPYTSINNLNSFLTKLDSKTHFNHAKIGSSLEQSLYLSLPNLFFFFFFFFKSKKETERPCFSWGLNISCRTVHSQYSWNLAPVSERKPQRWAGGSKEHLQLCIIIYLRFHCYSGVPGLLSVAWYPCQNP